jgi:site-specific DNA-cytosine methylase
MKRGAFLRKVRMATLCSGASPESKLCNVFKVPVKHVLICEQKQAAINFTNANLFNSGQHARPEYFGTDLKQLASEFRSPSLYHNFKEVTVVINKRTLDLLIAGISCKGYSYARSGRRANWVDHRDSWMIDSFLKLLDEWEPLFSILENVASFLRPDKATGMSPLHYLAQKIIEMGLHQKYVVSVLLSRGSLFGAQVRKRVWIVFAHRHHDGEGTISRLSLYYHDLLSYRAEFRGVSTMQIFMLESDARITDMLAQYANKRHKDNAIRFSSKACYYCLVCFYSCAVRSLYSSHIRSQKRASSSTSSDV